MHNWTRCGKEGLISDKVVKFSLAGATIFYWLLTWPLGLFVLIAIILLYTGLTTNKGIILTENVITAPNNRISKKIIPVKFDSFNELILLQPYNNRNTVVLLHYAPRAGYFSPPFHESFTKVCCNHALKIQT